MKILNLTDIKTTYQYDIVTCYEHPRAAVLHYYDSDLENAYIMLAKIYGIYNLTDKDNRVTIHQDICTGFGMNIITDRKLSWKLVKSYVDRDIPLIVGVNLKEIFYSEHYGKTHWAHWMIIKGYEDNGNVRIYDNTQYGTVGAHYGDFSIPFKYVLRANKSYEKNYDRQYSVNIFEKADMQNDIKRSMCILQKYIKIDVSESERYRQFHLLGEIKNLLKSEQSYADYYIEEFKKKLININKYRTAFHNEVIRNMNRYHYPSDKVSDMRELAKHSGELWKNYLLKMISAIVNHRSEQIYFDDELIQNENNIQECIQEYVDYMEYYNHTKEKRATEREYHLTYPVEHNQDNIIYGNDSKIVFEFDGNREYNWWLEDNAPKVCIKKAYYEDINLEKGMTFRVVMKITESETDSQQGQYKAGIYLKNHKTDKTYFCSITKEEVLEIDDVGICETIIKKEKVYHMEFVLKKNQFHFREFKTDCLAVSEQAERDTTMEQEILTEGMFEIGVACKTWEGGKNVRIEVMSNMI